MDKAGKTLYTNQQIPQLDGSERIMGPLITVIVPVYRVEDYLPRCVDSILGQTYEKLEVILVDDGSDDACPQICDDYARRDARVQVIHQKNKGISEARNAGIDRSTGELLTFVDSDDHLHSRMIEILYEQLCAHDADIAVCEIERVFSLERVEKPLSAVSAAVYSGLEAIASFYPGLQMHRIMTPCKLFVRKIFDNNRFRPGVICEDNYIIHHLYFTAQKVVFIDQKLYYYSVRSGSIMHSAYNLKSLDDIGAVEDRLSFLAGKAGPALMTAAYIDYLEKLIMHYYQLRSSLPNNKDASDMLRHKFRTAYRESLLRPRLSAAKKLKYGVFKVSAGLYKLLNKTVSLIRFHKWEMDFVVYPAIADGDPYG